jgi:hypothetical protein
MQEANMSQDNAREKLVGWLDRKAFDPVLHASPEAYKSAEEKKKLAYVQAATRRDKKRYHDDYRSAEDVYRNFHEDLGSDAAANVRQQLRDLHLPVTSDIEQDFDELAGRMGVGGH